MNIIIDRFNEISSKDQVLAGHKRRLGHVFVKNGVVVWEGRCPICGEWLSHDFGKDRLKLIAEGRWDFDKKRMTHCAKTRLCSDYYQDCLKAKERKMEESFEKYLKMGFVA